MATYSYINNDLVDFDDENEDENKYDDYSGSQPKGNYGNYIDHDLIDADDN